MPKLPERQTPMAVERHPEPPAPEVEPPGVERDAEAPLLTRLNRRGFRLVMLLDVTVLYAVTLGIMFVRFGTRWPTFPVPTYLVSFAIAVAIFTASLYFGGLYEREPRLGAPPTLPGRPGRRSRPAGSWRCSPRR
jgi:hypothetical protein